MMVQCECGQKYNIKESLYGKVVRCRKCGNNMQVGYPEQQIAVEPLPSQAAPQQPPQHPPTPQPQQPVYDPNAFGDLSDNQMSVGPSPYGSQFPARPVPKQMHSKSLQGTGRDPLTQARFRTTATCS